MWLEVQSRHAILHGEDLAMGLPALRLPPEVSVGMCGSPTSEMGFRENGTLLSLHCLLSKCFYSSLSPVQGGLPESVHQANGGLSLSEAPHTF